MALLDDLKNLFENIEYDNNSDNEWLKYCRIAGIQPDDTTAIKLMVTLSLTAIMRNNHDSIDHDRNMLLSALSYYNADNDDSNHAHNANKPAETLPDENANNSNANNAHAGIITPCNVNIHADNLKAYSKFNKKQEKDEDKENPTPNPWDILFEDTDDTDKKDNANKPVSDDDSNTQSNDANNSTVTVNSSITETTVNTGNSMIENHDELTWNDYNNAVSTISALIENNLNQKTGTIIQQLIKLNDSHDYMQFLRDKEFIFKNNPDDKLVAIMRRIIEIIKAGMPVAMQPVAFSRTNSISRIIMSALNGPFTMKQFIRTVVYFNGRCPYCGCIMTINNTQSATGKTPADTMRTGDHIIPIGNTPEQGLGETIYGNVILCCKKCNESKANMYLNEWLATRNYDVIRINGITRKINQFMKYAGYKPMDEKTGLFTCNEINSLSRLPFGMIDKSMINNTVSRINDYRNGKEPRPSAIATITDDYIMKTINKQHSQGQANRLSQVKWVDPIINNMLIDIRRKRNHRAKDETILKAMNENNDEQLIKQHIPYVDMNAINMNMIKLSLKNHDKLHELMKINILQGGLCAKCMTPMNGNYRIKNINGITMMLCSSCSSNNQNDDIRQFHNDDSKRILLRIGWKPEK